LKTALIVGVTGQDGSYLAEWLLSLGYEVHGLVRRASSLNTSRIDHLYEEDQTRGKRFFLHYGDLTDSSRLFSLLSQIKPDEIYNLGAQSHVRVSFDEPLNTGNVIALGNTRLLEAVRLVSPASKYLHASTSEMFGDTPSPQNEFSSFSPQSPYAAAKLYAYWMTRNYRDAHSIFAVNAIMFNHESPRRGQTFVTKKITAAASRISLGSSEKLFLGNLDAKRDFGYAPEYVRAMWLMLQREETQDYVLATGRSITVRDFLSKAFSHVGLDWRDYTEIDEKYFRPTEVSDLQGDASIARESLGWEARVLIDELVEIMVEHDLRLMKGPRTRIVDVPRFGD
jgi:GDPmannose 4,6-dehydratase